MPDHTTFADYIGRKAPAKRDLITPRLLAAYNVTFGDALFRPDANSDPMPLGIHWCLAPDIVAADKLGEDGHPAKGGDNLIPPVPLPRRMWAGGSLAFHQPFPLGAEVEKQSTITAIDWKQGRSGELCFITLQHQYTSGGSLLLDETQNVVYRQAASGKASPNKDAKATRPSIDAQAKFALDSTTLFRYSALTFNGHRIHYDQPYARDKEGYSDLVVHGPLQASLLLNFAAKHRQQAPKRFSYRGVAPAICGGELTIAAIKQDGQPAFATIDKKGVVTMMARAEW